jgi:hypothetical protein
MEDGYFVFVLQTEIRKMTNKWRTTLAAPFSAQGIVCNGEQALQEGWDGRGHRTNHFRTVTHLQRDVVMGLREVEAAKRNSSLSG